MNHNNFKHQGRVIIPAFLILFFLSGFKGYATDGVFKGSPLYGKNRQISKDSIIYVADTILNNTSFRAGWTVKKVRNIVTFKIDEFANLIIPDSSQVTLNFRFTITKWVYSSNQPAAAVTTTADSTLTITYYKSQPYSNKAVLVLPDVFSSSVKISSISLTDTTTNFYKSLMVENEVQTTREYTSFDCTNNIIQAINQSTALVNAAGELKVFWSPSKGADEYDLEWAYIDSSALQNYYIASTTNFDPLKIFDNNATRVSLSNESYNIPLLYDNKGTLFFRVRSVQIRNNGQRIEAGWSSVNAAGLGSYVFTGHERKLNWQANTSFAEDGKRKSVIQYFDGSLRNRQTVTKDNTTDSTIIAETFYDNQGRAVIQVLPSPSLNRIIKYTPNFNSPVNGAEYDKSHYDDVMSNGADYCAKGADKLSTASGASQYYSPQNQNVNNGYNKFIPDAKGYPFTETKYTQDNTGRISAQGGVGPNHQLGQTDLTDNSTLNHETKYFYGTADKEDLDALFGTEAGNYTHYFKNMVRDANGQYSVSYIDMHGRTIATALAGTPGPSSLDALPSNQTRTITKQLLDSNNNIIKGNAIESIKNLVVTKNGNHYFNYSLTPQSLQLLDCNNAAICYDCLYDLTITVTDNCNNQNLPGGVPHVITKKNFTLFQPDTTCANAPLFSVLDTLNLKEGVYAITKRLEISKFAADYYRDSIFLKHNTCKSLSQFIAEQKQIILSTLNCTPTCQQCTDSLGTWATFRPKYMQRLGISPADSAGYRGDALQAYNSQLEDCNLLCEKLTVVDNMRTNMLADMTAPFGQYANDADSIESKRDYYSIYNRVGGLSTGSLRYQKPVDPSVYLDPAGKVSTVLDANQQPQQPQNLSIEQFNDNFVSSWATSLLSYHPEYKKYLLYSKLKPSLSWDEQFLKVETFREAFTSGYLNPTANSTSPFNKYPIVTANADVFYKNEADSFATSNFKTAMEAYMKDVAGDATNPLSMWAAATSMAKCENGDATCLGNYRNGTYAFDSTGTYALCKGELDMAWRYFREMYMNKKRKLTNDFINTSSPVTPAPGSQHVLHFVDVNPLLAPGGALASDYPQGMDSLTIFINDNCTNAAVQWWRELAPCYYTSADSAVIIPRLIAVCKAGGDENHPYGSSSVKPGSTNPFKTFEEVIKNYNQNHTPVIPYNANCNAELITDPQPYDQQQPVNNIEVWGTPDSCLCSTINTLYTQYTQPGNADTSFAAYVTRVNGATMSEANLQALRSMCGVNACKFSEAPIVVPPALQCGITNACVSCAQVKTLYDSFKVSFPSIALSYDENDSLQRTKNHVFERYMNHRLGFAKSTQEYLAFMDTCGRFTTAPCDSMQNILKTFVQTLKPGRVVHTLESEYNGPVYHDLSKIIDNGTIHFPDSLRQIPGSWYNNYGVSMNSFCTNNGYSAEIRFKFLQNNNFNGDIFYSSLGGNIVGFNGERFSNGFYLYTTHAVPNYYLLDPNPNAQLNWMVFKVKVLPSMCYVYYNGTLIFQKPRDSTVPIGQMANFGMGLLGRHGCIDWIKIRDAQDSLKFFEDFNNANYPATVDPSFVCPAQPNCQTTFTNYYNQARGTNYTFNQIDSLYRLNCGKPLDVCSNNNTSQDTAVVTTLLNGPKLCGKLQPAFPTLNPVQWGPCDDSTNFSIVKGTQLYNVYRDSLNDVFSQAYTQKCLAAQKLENFTVTAPISEYHYTLYYYGQAGNLIKTVPPQGVDLSKFTDATWAATVAAARKNRTSAVPNHTLVTIYRYNSLNQVVAQYTPDAKKSEFWYDRLGRLAISQNSKQKSITAAENGRSYSYTLYDYIGRITEVGEYINPSTTPMADVLSRNQAQLNTWLATQANRSQITSTVYDLEYPGWVSPNKQVSAKNLRNRVAYSSYTTGSNPANFNQATFYSYDILGNVDTLIQDYGNNVAGNGTQNMMNNNGNRWKKIVYQYDLISGKVNHVAYQPQYINTSDNKLYTPKDAFYHKYEYDAENRLTAVYTSTDSVVWEKDARYEYYKHGPLARTVLGDQLVQGIDYSYTLQGWLKGVNSTGLKETVDMGKDGNTATGSSQNQYIAKDVMGFALHYYNGDYTAVNAAFNASTLTPFPEVKTGLSAQTPLAYLPLFNGNISSMAVNVKALTKPGGGTGAVLYNYKYDQLNRLTSFDPYIGFTIGNTWPATTTAKNEYKERITYDANGNILKYFRNGSVTATLLMDSLSYKYKPGTNQLDYVKDSVPSGSYNSSNYEDIDSQVPGNFAYDSIGNLIKDSSENVSNITWNVYGKINSVAYSNTAVNSLKNVYYYYDASGNRMGKRVETITSTGTGNNYTWYVRDASGNVMSVYTATASNASIPTNLSVNERHLYGSSRLGILTIKQDVKAAMPSYVSGSPYKSNFMRGNKYYELSNHLGNVLTTISDEKVGHDAGNGTIDYYDADIVSASDYYPFGSAMPSRATNTSAYRYSFNGKEKDKDGNGQSIQYDYGFRIYDPHLGRFKSVDPQGQKFPNWSPYSFCLNNPIFLIDPDGQEPIKPQVGTIAGFIAFLNNTRSKMGTLTGVYGHNAMMRLGKTEMNWKHLRPEPMTTNPFNTSKDKYIYTEKGGWLDMAHFMFYAGKAYEYKNRKEVLENVAKTSKNDPVVSSLALAQAKSINPVGDAVQDGYHQEMTDRFVAGRSAYSYEDLPSDKLGAEFGANYYNPKSKLTLGEQLKNYIEGLGATDPKNAPNYDKLPLDDSKFDNPTRTNHTTKPIYTKENP